MKKAYAYITRQYHGRTQVLVFRHPVKEAGIQVPKGTVKQGEHTYDAAVREVMEETGLTSFKVDRLLAEDKWLNDDGAVHHRFFYKINVEDAPDRWEHNPSGGGAEEGLTFHFFWISGKDEVELIRGYGDYLQMIFSAYSYFSADRGNTHLGRIGLV